MSNSEVIKGYHYTRHHNQILREGLAPRTNLVRDILPYDFKNFLFAADIEEDMLSFLSMPKDSYSYVTKGLLEPKPDSWANNQEYPNLWKKLMSGLFPFYPEQDWQWAYYPPDYELTLLEFDLTPQDDAFVFEEGHSRKIHDFKLPIDLEGFDRKNIDHLRRRSEEIRNQVRKYYESKISWFQYKGDYKIPLLVLGNTITSKRLKIHSITLLKDIPGMEYCIDERAKAWR